MTGRLDLSQCEDEPIHIPGSIQPHGALIGISEPALEIVLASQNAAELLGGGSDLTGARLDRLVQDQTLKTLRAALAGDPRDANPMAITLLDGSEAHGLAHRSDGLLLLELEPAGEDRLRFRSAYQRLVRRFERLRRAQTLQDVCDLATHEIQRLTGFDRVMVYRFDKRANGEVIAEERADDDLKPFLGLHYPASDIPPQARRLYVENPIRLIVDVDYEPVRLDPDLNPLTGRPLDLSQASLRSVSPIHCEYLRNMGVGASMSISLLSGDELWGLIACHHRTPLHVPHGTRLVAEFLAHVLSARVSEMQRVEALTRKTAAYAVQSRLVDEMVAASRFEEGLTKSEPSLIDLIDCDGAAILFRGEVTRIGETPEADEIRALAAGLGPFGHGSVISTSLLSDLYPPAEAWADRAAGCIAVPISADGADLLLWFRGEWIRSVTWAGDPAKPMIQSDDGARLEPRASFAAWVEEVRGQSRPWEDWEIEVASDFRTALVASVVHQAAELERLNASLVAESRHKDRFLATVSHELRNPLNAILGWVRIARMGLEGPELDQALETIERNAQSQTELIGDLLDVSQLEGGRLRLEIRTLDLAETLHEALATVEPTARSKSIRIETEIGEDRAEVMGDSRRLQQVIWNLVTNAIKFSPPESLIRVSLSRLSSYVALSVEDEGEGIAPDLLPNVFEAFRQGEGSERAAGLGLGLSIVKSIVELHSGRVSVESEGEGRGARFTVVLPVAVLRPGAESDDRPVGVDLSNTRILVVEDQDDARRMVVALLERHGAEVIEAQHGREALEALTRNGVDLVVSDLDMPDMDGFELAQTMKSRPELAKVPAIALTAYTRGGDRAKALTSGFRHHVSKPVDPDELLAVVASVLERLD